MYQRLIGKFGSKNVGIYHSVSRFMHHIKGKLITEDDQDVIQDDDILTIIKEERVFLKPVMVTTVDHLVYSLVHGFKQADYAFGNILNSVVIFDEIHYYEYHTLRYIIEAMDILQELKIPLIAMSGTLPDCIIKKLGVQYNIIKDTEGFRFKPFLIKLQPCFIDNAIKEIVSLYKKREKQIVIVNTIAKAQSIYNELINKIGKQNNILLYHSMFTHFDRAYSKKSKESIMFKWKTNYNNSLRWIIISTQAIEISVDISCTIMHTEMAPIDAIGQRGGRLNRGNKFHNNKAIMHIYKTENYKPYYFNKEGEINLIQETEKVIIDGEITYELFQNWCSQIYKDVDFPPQNLKIIFNDCTLFGRTPKEIRYSEDEGNLIMFRENYYIKQDVIPEIYWNSELKKYPELIMVKIPYWWLNKYPDYFYVEQEKYTICRLPYSSEEGFVLDKIYNEDKNYLFF